MTDKETLIEELARAIRAADNEDAGCEMPDNPEAQAWAEKIAQAILLIIQRREIEAGEKVRVELEAEIAQWKQLHADNVRCYDKAVADREHFRAMIGKPADQIEADGQRIAEQDEHLRTVLTREAETIRRYDAKLDAKDQRIAELEADEKALFAGQKAATKIIEADMDKIAELKAKLAVAETQLECANEALREQLDIRQKLERKIGAMRVAFRANVLRHGFTEDELNEALKEVGDD